MRILLQTSTFGYKTYHALAKRIKEQFPETIFGMEAISPAAEKFHKEQTDIEYEIFDMGHGDVNEYEIDFEILRKFEDRLPHKSLWRSIAVNRNLGNAFLHGSVGYESEYSIDRDYILRYYSNRIITIKKLFNEFKPDIYIPAVAMGGFDVTIFCEVCKESNVLYLVPGSSRVKNYCAFSNNHQLTFPQIDYLTQKLLNNKIELDKTSAEKLFNEIMNELEDPDYFDSKNARLKKVEFRGPSHRIFFMAGAISYYIITIIINNLLMCFRGLLKGHKLKIFSFIKVYREVRNRVLSVLQKLKLTHPKFGTILEPSQKYIYFPLSGQPEYSNNVLGTMWMDHHHLIETLAKSIPHDWVVYVKEHPGVLSDRVRPMNFYKKIERLPNVFLAPIYTSSHEIISNAEMVAVISGTSGWEAIWRGKPVIEFRMNLWSVLDLSKKCTDIDTLSNDIYEEIKRINKISPKERKRRIVCLLSAMLELGFRVTYPKQLFYIEPGSDEEYEVCGRELAEGLVKHLNYLQEEKGYSFGISQET
jgi:hypothetical protein